MKHSCTVFWDRHWSWSDLCFALVQCGYLYALQENATGTSSASCKCKWELCAFHTLTSPDRNLPHWNNNWKPSMNSMKFSRNHLPLTNSFELSQPRCPLLWQTQLPKARLCLRGFGGPVWIGLTPYKTQSFAASQRLVQNLRTSLCIVCDPVRFIYVARVVLLASVVERQFGDFRHIRLLQCRVRSLFDRCHV